MSNAGLPTDKEPADDSTERAVAMTPILILKAFGHFPSTSLIESERERERRERMAPPTGAVKTSILHRAFEARAKFMGWATYHKPPPNPPLWNMFEAGLVDRDDDPSLIGWAYVGMANPTDLRKVTPDVIQPGTGPGWAAIQVPPGYDEATVAIPVAIPPFVQCLDDALRRIGATDVSGYQLTCHRANLQPSKQSRGHLISLIGWFHVPAPDAMPADALVAFDRGFLGGLPASGLMSRVGRKRYEPFEFSLAPDVPDQHRIKAPGSIIQSVTFDPSEIGLSVRMPEWSASAAGWVLATVIDAARAVAPGVEDFEIRISRVR